MEGSLHENPSNVLWDSISTICVCLLPPNLPPCMPVDISGEERWAQGICFYGFLSFFLQIFYLSPFGRDILKTL